MTKLTTAAGVGLATESALLLSLTATALIMLFSLSGIVAYLGRGQRPHHATHARGSRE